MVQDTLTKEQFWEVLSTDPVYIQDITVMGDSYLGSMDIFYDGTLYSTIKVYRDSIQTSLMINRNMYISLFEFPKGTTVQFMYSYDFTEHGLKNGIKIVEY